MTPSPARALALYLPQFHPIPENDEWWGPGFTEWTNTRKARPLFPGHRQPHVSTELGEYDLRDPDARAAQADMARSHGIEGFIYWHYWFAGRRILERPFDEVLASGEPDLPFALAWANQSWTGIWHGAPNRMLIEQTYPGPDDDRAHFDSILPALRDPRYICVDERPLLYVFRPEQLPEPARFVERWQAMAEAAGLPGLHLVAEMTTWLGGDPLYTSAAADGFDAVADVGLPVSSSPLASAAARAARRLGRPAIYHHTRHLPPVPPAAPRDVPVLPCVFPGWDNTPRSARRGIVVLGSTPARFGRHVREAIERVAPLPAEQRLVFVKSWNEWAEGNHLEPDARWGRQHLEALRDALART